MAGALAGRGSPAADAAATSRITSPSSAPMEQADTAQGPRTLSLSLSGHPKGGGG
jgi:hypothetical protein